jgi:Chalcone isomerase-like
MKERPRPLCGPLSRCRAAVVACVVVGLSCLAPHAARPAVGAELDGVAMPDTLRAAGTPLTLNGMGVRTYSIFSIRIYVAGLYLEHPTRDPEAILNSDTVKLLQIRFVHDVDAERARDAWMRGFRNNCKAPCELPHPDLEQFLAAVPDFHSGDQSEMLFSGHSVAFSVNGRPYGTVSNPVFARTILANFLYGGPRLEGFRQGLLGERE